MNEPVIAACLKWVDRRPDVDPLTGDTVHDPRSAGTSEADDAALEWALRLGECWRVPVLAISAGPAEADDVLRHALAVGATSAVRVRSAVDTPSELVAASLIAALPGDVAVTVCGNWSMDRGSGSVPAFLAASQGAAQALGLISLAFAERERELRAERRLDGGRRERLRIPLPAVVSVEGGSAHLRRASLGGVIGARTASITVVDGPPAPSHEQATAGVRRGPYRPRPRARAAPTSSSARERVLELTGALADPSPPQRLVLDPPAAAVRIVEQLRSWGYIE